MSNRLRLGVNIDHVATIRNARGGDHPDPVRAAIMAARAGADGIAVHNSHAAAYALVAYQTAYMKAHHPAAFMAANMSALCQTLVSIESDAWMPCLRRAWAGG